MTGLISGVDNSDVVANTSMVWFSLLNLDDRVALLAEPGMPLPRSLADDLRRMDPSYVVGEAVWTANYTGNAAEQLLPSLQGVLATYREPLLKWWRTLSVDDQSMFIEHRDGSLPESSWDLARSAPGGMASTIMDSTKREVSLTPIAQVFLEWKARERNS